METTVQEAKQECGCDEFSAISALVTVEAATKAGLDLAITITDSEVLPLEGALGRILSEPVRTKMPMPPFDNSAMDGFAMNVGDLSGVGPWKLSVQGRSAAGEAKVQDLVAGTVQRIFTGAPIPRGANAVIMQERVHVEKGWASFSVKPSPGENVRCSGEDIDSDVKVLPVGTELRPQAIALAAGAGAGTVSVTRKLRVAFLATGDEVQPAGQPLPRGGIWDVNTPMMVAALSGPTSTVICKEAVQDNLGTLARLLKELSQIADLIVTTGGVSVGEEDHMRSAILNAGGEVHVAGVAVKPGKPLTLGRIGSAVVVALPGNPVSALVTWAVFGTSILAKLAGSTHQMNEYCKVIANVPLQHKVGRTEFRPARIVEVGQNGQKIVTAQKATHSARLWPLAQADGLVVIPADTSLINKGEPLEFLPFDNLN